MPTRHGFRLRPLSPDSNVIGINYDGTTAGKKRDGSANFFSPRNSLDRAALAGLGFGASLAWRSRRTGLPSCGPGLDHRAGDRQPLQRSCHRGFRPGGLFHRCPPEARPAREFEASQAGAVWRFRNEGNRASFVAHPEIYGPQFGGYDPIDLARGVTVAGNPAVLAGLGPAALSVRPRGDPGRLCRRSVARAAAARTSAGRRSRRHWPSSRCAGLESAPCRSHQPTAVGSPQAMNSGTIKSRAPLAELAKSAPLRIRDLAAGGGDDGVTGRDVPFAGRRQPRIDIDRALRHPPI